MERKILVLGSSHTAAIAKAATDLDDFRAAWVKNPKRDDGPGDITVPQAIENAAATGPSDIIAITWMGTYHNIFGLIQHEQPFDFFEPGNRVEPDLTREIVPYSTLHQQFAATVSTDTFTRKITQATTAKVVVLATPPVKGDNDFIRSKLKNYRGHNVEESGVTPAAIRAKLWRLEMLCLAAHCAKSRLEFIPAPKEAITIDGFLRADLYGGDATHANADYGAMVINQLCQLRDQRT
ncbi:hypothetical protein JNB71_14255 [Rhizobium herbae]|uniref:SGNH/GDSL hydrolase family protein n=1 Tax=Rhizobium herbae TaxID=508661 RepID=A0ABS7HD45_9HYPH|nr:hypothetical protein [Rhizobium herbae]MBW9064487.1 hypothetical protein [Rhizobium herbae]